MDSRLDMSQQCAQVAKRPMAPALDQEWCGQQDQGSDFFPVLSAGWEAPGLCPVLRPPNKEGHGGAGECPEKDNKGGEGCEHRTQVL